MFLTFLQQLIQLHEQLSTGDRLRFFRSNAITFCASSYSEKYKNDELSQANKTILRRKLSDWAHRHNMTLSQAYDVLDFNWLEQQEEKEEN